jgi:hypothetical protein
MRQAVQCHALALIIALAVSPTGTPLSVFDSGVAVEAQKTSDDGQISTIQGNCPGKGSFFRFVGRSHG